MLNKQSKYFKALTSVLTFLSRQTTPTVEQQAAYTMFIIIIIFFAVLILGGLIAWLFSSRRD